MSLFYFHLHNYFFVFVLFSVLLLFFFSTHPIIPATLNSSIVFFLFSFFVCLFVFVVVIVRIFVCLFAFLSRLNLVQEETQ